MCVYEYICITWTHLRTHRQGRCSFPRVNVNTTTPLLKEVQYIIICLCIHSFIRLRTTASLDRVSPPYVDTPTDAPSRCTVPFSTHSNNYILHL